MPTSIMASRSSFELKTLRSLSSVTPSRSMRVTSTKPSPGGMSPTRNVYTRRSGAATSRYSPWKSTSSPPDVCVMYRHWPPGRTSIVLTSVASRRNPHQRGMRSGSVIVSHTTSRGASNLRVMRISRSDGKVSVVSCFVLVAMVFPQSFLCLPLADQVVQPIHPIAHPAPEFLQPRVELVEGLRPQLIDALLRDRTHVDQPGVTQHAEVLRHLRLTQSEALGDLPYRARPVAEKLDDPETIRFGQGRQRGVHGVIYIPVRIYLSRHIQELIPPVRWPRHPAFSP